MLDEDSAAGTVLFASTIPRYYCMHHMVDEGGEVPLTEARLDAARVDKPNSILLYFFEVAWFFFGEEL